MKLITYKLIKSINMKVPSNIPKSAIPFDKLRLASVVRGPSKSPYEVGPTHYFGTIPGNGNFYFSWDCNTQSLQVLLTNKKLKKYSDNDTIKSICTFAKVDTRWLSAKDMPTKQVSNSANVFGASGYAFVRRAHALNIQSVNGLDCRQTLFETFGIRIIPFGEVLPRNEERHKLLMVAYRINDKFVKKWVHAPNGPGIFLEHHNFAHYLTPMTYDSRGPIVIGKQLNNTTLLLVGVHVPLGYTLYIPANIVHNDWYFTGTVATSVYLDDEADTVFLRGYHNKKIPIKFSQMYTNDI